MARLRAAVAVGLALAMLLAACTSGDDEATKAGGPSSTLVLRLGYYDERDETQGVEHVEMFARQVSTLSDGALRIEPVWNASGAARPNEPVDDWDQVVARRVIDGDLDMGLIAARAWDTEGVSTLRALNAPMLVTTDAMVEQVVTSDLAPDLMAGLADVGVKGLALLPEDLRRLFVYGDRLDSLTDFGGAFIWAPRSETVYAYLSALGGNPDDLPGGTPRAVSLASAGSLGAAEASFVVNPPSVAGTAVGNVVLFPKVNALVITGKAWDGLTDDQRDVLKDAAERARDWAIDEVVPDAEHAETYCRNGGTIVLVGDDVVADLRAAAEPVYADLAQDPATRTLMQGLRVLAERAGDVGLPMSACAPQPVDVEAPTESASSEFPDGTYRLFMPTKFLLDAGIDQRTAIEHDDTWTLTFEDGKFRDGDICRGAYAVESGRVSIVLEDQSDCGTAANMELFSAEWTVDGDQLRFLDVRSGHGFQLLIENLFGGLPWTKIS